MVFWHLCWLSLLFNAMGKCIGVERGFVATIQLTEIIVPDNKILNGKHCDSYDMFGVYCDIKTRICVESLTDSSTDLKECKTGTYKDSSVYEPDTDDVIIEPNRWYSNWPVPYKFTYSTSIGYMGVRLKVILLDSEFGVFQDKKINQFYVDITDPVGTNKLDHSFSSSRPNLLPTIFKLKYSVVCKAGAECDLMSTIRLPPSTIKLLPTTTPVPPSCNLKNSEFDIMEIVDASSHMGVKNYNDVLNFLAQFLKQFTIGRDRHQTEFSSGYYAEDAGCYLLWWEQNYKSAIKNMKSWIYPGGNYSHLAKGLFNVQLVTEDTGYRPSAKNVAIIFGPGIIDDSQEDGERYAQSLREKGMTILAIALGESKVNTDILKKLTGSPNHVLQLSSADQLNTVAFHWLNQWFCSL